MDEADGASDADGRVPQGPGEKVLAGTSRSNWQTPLVLVRKLR